MSEATGSAGSDWYESAVASLFTFEMGYRTGTHMDQEVGHRLGTSILLHQSPLDQFFGDTIAGWDGRYFLVEFKREWASIPSELDKPFRVRLLNDYARALPEYSSGDIRQRILYLNKGINPAAGNVERGTWFLEHGLSTHFLAHGSTLNADHLEIEVAPYLRNLDERFATPRYGSVAAFFDGLTAPATTPLIGVPRSTFAAYLARLLMIAREAGDGDHSDNSSGCLGVASSHGCVSIPFPDTRSLLWLLENSNAIAVEIERIRSNTRGNTRGGRRSPSA